MNAPMINTTSARSGGVSADEFDQGYLDQLADRLELILANPALSPDARKSIEYWAKDDFDNLFNGKPEDVKRLIKSLHNNGGRLWALGDDPQPADDRAAAGHSASPEPIPEQPEPQAPARNPDFDLDSARAFLSALGTGHTFQTFDDNKARKSGSLAKVLNGSFDQHSEALQDLNGSGAGIFVTVNQTDGKGRKGTNITRTRAIFADFDGEEAEVNFKAAATKLQPSIVVQSSPGKYHAYWLCDLDVLEGHAIQWKMPAATGCDKDARDIGRVLRIPGFFHRKGDPVQVKLIESHADLKYDAIEIKAAFGLDSIEDTRPSHQERDALASTGGLECLISARDETLLRDALKRLDPQPYGTWAAVCAALCHSGQIGYRLFLEWSKTAPNYDEGACLFKYNNGGFDKSNYPAVFSMAQKLGWVMSEAASEQVKSQAPDEVPAPEKHSAQLAWPPGMVGEIASYILASSRMPVPSFAIAAALSVVSYLIRNFGHVAPSDTGLNLFQVLIGGTGKGKEDPRKAIKRLLGAMGDDGVVKQVTENLSSGTALLRALSSEGMTPNLFVMSDEYGIFMQAAMQGKDEHRRDLVKELMSLYGLARSFHSGKRYADPKQNIPPIDKPYVVTLGTTTEEELFAGLNMTSINNGSANRNIYIYPDVDAKPNRRPDIDVPKSLVDSLNALFGVFAHCEFHAMEYAPGAENLISAFGDNLPTKGKFANLWSRAEENAIRVAGVLAYCDGKVIKPEHVMWAIEYVSTSIKAFDQRSETQITENQFDKLLSKALNIIANPRHYSNDHKFSKHTGRGKMPRGKLLNLLKIKSRELDEVITALSEGGQIYGAMDDGLAVYWV